MKKRKFADGGIYTAEMGKPPTDPEGVPATKKAAPKNPPPPPKKPAPPKDTVFREGMPVPQDVDGASVKKMAKGGSAKYMSFDSKGKSAGMKSVTKMASGGYTKAADGIASKGKTKGKMVAMCGGGMMKRK